jgi:hypothetical protein
MTKRPGPHGACTQRFGERPGTNIHQPGRPASAVQGLMLKFVVTFISTSIGTQFSSVVLNCH